MFSVHLDYLTGDLFTLQSIRYYDISQPNRSAVFFVFFLNVPELKCEKIFSLVVLQGILYLFKYYDSKILVEANCQKIEK